MASPPASDVTVIVGRDYLAQTPNKTAPVK
jgi:hypothetical protein